VSRGPDNMSLMTSFMKYVDAFRRYERDKTDSRTGARVDNLTA